MLKYLTHQSIIVLSSSITFEISSNMSALFGDRCWMNSATVTQARLSITADTMVEIEPACGQ